MKHALSEGDEADPVVIHAWMIRLENRLCANLGTLEHLKLKREIDNVIYEIKNIVYSYHNLDDLQFVSSFLAYWAEINIISREHAKDCGAHFLQLVRQYFYSRTNRIISFKISNPNILNLFREFSIHSVDYDRFRSAAQFIANSILQSYQMSKQTQFMLQITFRLLPPPHPMSSNEFLLSLYIDKVKDIIELHDYMCVISENYANEIVRLGLGAFELSTPLRHKDQ